MGKARGQRVVNFTCFPSNKYQVGRQEPLQGGGGGRGATGRVAGGSTGQPRPSPPHLQFSIPIPISAPFHPSLHHLVRISRQLEMLVEMLFFLPGS